MRLTYLLAAGAAAFAMGGAACAQTTSGAKQTSAANEPAQADQAAPVAPGANVGQPDRSGAAVNPTPDQQPGGQSASGASTTVSSTSGTTTGGTAESAGGYGANASFTTQTIAMAPIPDTPANRAKFGGPMSAAGRHTKPAGN